MKQRFKVDVDGSLKNHRGQKVGKIISVTLELDDSVDEVTQEPIPGSGLDAPAQIWEHYVQVMKPRNKGLDKQTRALIRDALTVATLDECKRAIDGCRNSDFHMGVNDRRRKYNTISHILKGKRGTRTTREQIDLFLDIAERKGVQPGMASADSARINTAKRDVLAAHEFPGDEDTVRRGSEARQWLLSQGWSIGEEESGPTFAPPGAQPAP